MDHQNVIRLFDDLVNEEKGKLYLILEYCVTSLQDLLESAPEKKFPTAQAHFYFTQIIYGLGKAAVLSDLAAMAWNKGVC